MDRPRLLAAMGACRESITHEMARMVIGGPLYYSASTVVAAIDGFALMLTGQRDYFHIKGHGGQHEHDGGIHCRPEAALIKISNLFANVATNLSAEEITILAEPPVRGSNGSSRLDRRVHRASGTIRTKPNGSSYWPVRRGF
ncbi:MAG: hypothetical protein WA733_15670 [Methylocystis sp.]